MVEVLIHKGNIFKYTNVSDYLSAWHAINKKKNDNFGFRTIAAILGCNSTSEIYRIIKEKKLPSEMMVYRFILAIELDPDESNYLILMSSLTRAGAEHKAKLKLLGRYKRLMKK